jgi:uncharacterized protein YqjF (DUF2071 family)
VTTRRAFLTAEWRWLVMLNYEIDPHLLLPMVPTGTSLDLWEGHALVSVVGFQFLHTAVAGIPVPFHQRFEEVNLRFYVRREVAGEVRRGVTFIRELVPRAAIAWGARLVYNEPYRALPMRSTAPSAGDSPGRLEYGWRDGADWHHVSAEATGVPEVPSQNDERAFIAEHYWGYGRARDGVTLEYEVSHPRWRVWTATAPEFTGDALTLYGEQFAPTLAAPPLSAFVAEGSPVTVFRAVRLQEGHPR